MAGQLSHLSVHIHAGENKAYISVAEEFVMVEY